MTDSHKNNDAGQPGQFSLRKLVILIILLNLAIGGYTLFNGVIADRETGAEEVNIAGRQRMLSQKIGLLVVQLSQTQSAEERGKLRERLAGATRLMRHSHDRLTKGDVVNNGSTIWSQSLRRLYFGPTSNVDRDIRTFLATAERYLTEKGPAVLKTAEGMSMTEWVSGRFLTDLDRVVSEYQRESSERIAELKIYQNVALAAALLLLVFTAFAIFNPALLSRRVSAIGRDDRDPVNPVLVTATRGVIKESIHRGSFIAMNAKGEVVLSEGVVARQVYPRSAVKLIQALPLITSGAADAFGFSDSELALACSSHGGEARHVEGVKSMLSKIGLTADDLECGIQPPTHYPSALALAAEGKEPTALHNGCSGKHAGFLALAKHLDVRHKKYVEVNHRVQREVLQGLLSICKTKLPSIAEGIDGCSAPNWALPMDRLAHGFARIADPSSLPQDYQVAAKRLLYAATANPLMTAATGHYSTRIMEVMGQRVYIKNGAEGVFCAAIPSLGLGVALKCDDGASRGAEAMLTAVLDKLGVFTFADREKMKDLFDVRLLNYRGRETGGLKKTI